MKALIFFRIFFRRRASSELSLCREPLRHNQPSRNFSDKPFPLYNQTSKGNDGEK